MKKTLKDFGDRFAVRPKEKSSLRAFFHSTPLCSRMRPNLVLQCVTSSRCRKSVTNQECHAVAEVCPVAPVEARGVAMLVSKT
jgi:hypothetical protein